MPDAARSPPETLSRRSGLVRIAGPSPRSPFQEEVWAAFARGESGLIHAPTGMGKTYAACAARWPAASPARPTRPPPLAVLWITPLRALAADTGLALPRAARRPAAALDGRRAHRRHARRRARAAGRAAADGARHHAGEPVAAAVARRLARALRAPRRRWSSTSGTSCWRSKRGVQVELALARLRGAAARPARLGPVGDARQPRRGAAPRCSAPARRAAGAHRPGPRGEARSTSTPSRPPTIERFPWAGHIGAAAAAGGGARDRVARARRWCSPTCARRPEIWYQALLEARPDWAGPIALHHGSLEREVRDWVEDGLRDGRLRARGLHVEPRPRRRLRAGRPGAADRQPEGRRAAAAARRPQRPPARRDLARHRACRRTRSSWSRPRPRARRPRTAQLEPRVAAGRARSTCWCSTSSPARSAAASDPDELLAEVRGTHAYAALDRRRVALGARLRRPRRREPQRLSRVPPRGDRRRRRRAGARRADRAPAPHADRHHRRRGEHHRALPQRRRRSATSRSRFIARLAAGDCFVFAGRVLEFVRVREMTAWVKPGAGARGASCRAGWAARWRCPRCSPSGRAA